MSLTKMEAQVPTSLSTIAVQTVTQTHLLGNSLPHSFPKVRSISPGMMSRIPIETLPSLNRMLPDVLFLHSHSTSSVLDLNLLQWLNNAEVNYPGVFNQMAHADGTFNNRDITMNLLRTNHCNIGHCLEDVIRVGFIDTQSIGCGPLRLTHLHYRCRFDTILHGSLVNGVLRLRIGQTISIVLLLLTGRMSARMG